MTSSETFSTNLLGDLGSSHMTENMIMFETRTSALMETQSLIDDTRFFTQNIIMIPQPTSTPMPLIVSSFHERTHSKSTQIASSVTLPDSNNSKTNQLSYNSSALIGALSSFAFLLLIVLASGTVIFCIYFKNKQKKIIDNATDKNLESATDDYVTMRSATENITKIGEETEQESTTTVPDAANDRIVMASKEKDVTSDEGLKTTSPEHAGSDQEFIHDQSFQEFKKENIFQISSWSSEKVNDEQHDAINQVKANRDSNIATKSADEDLESPWKPEDSHLITESSEELEGIPAFDPIYDLPCVESLTLPIITQENINKKKTLGVGFFGKVVLADTVHLSKKDLNMSNSDDDKSINIQVAVKLLKTNPSSSIRDSFDKELKVMSRLKHENVVQVLGACIDDKPFIIMEYMDKGDLHDYLQTYDKIHFDDTPSTDLSVRVNFLIGASKQIANGMKYLSSKSIVHRDIAARNCLLGGDLTVKISDFGMSRNLYRSHYYIMKSNGIVPLRWMAKECFSGKFSTKSDVWAFGVTLWEIFTLAKCIPYEDMTDGEVIADITKKKRTLLQKPSHCPDSVYGIMLMCWKEEAEERKRFVDLYDDLSSIH